MAFTDWSTNPANNSLVGGITWSNGMLPSQIDDSGRQMMADLAAWRLSAAFGGDIFFLNTDTTEQHITFRKAGRDTYLYSNATEIGVYDSIRGFGWQFRFSDGAFLIKGQQAITAGANVGSISFTGEVKGGSITGGLVTSTGSGIGYVSLVVGDATHTGYVGVFNAAGARQGYSGFALTNGSIGYQSDTGAGHSFTGGRVSSDTDFRAPILRATSDGTGQNIAIGNDVWLGDVNTASTVSIRGQSDPTSGYVTFGQSGVLLGVNASGDMKVVGGNFGVNIGRALFLSDTGTYVFCDIPTGKMKFAVGGNIVASLDSAGNFRCLGNITGNAVTL